MARVYKWNARERLIKTCDKFYKLTGEVVGIVMTWKGALTVLGPEHFRSFISPQKDAIWNSLSPKSLCHQQSNETLHGAHMQELLRGDVASYTMQSLRRIVSSLTKESVGTFLKTL